MWPGPSPLRISAVAVLLAGLAIVTGLDTRVFTQAPAPVDYRRDVQPLLRERCLGCHGPSQQMNGYRLDRRSAALGGVIRPNIVAGSSESSRLYHRLIGGQFGAQMPPTGALAPDEIALIKRWIDEGAAWPDALANEVDLPPPDPDATRLTQAIRQSGADAVVTDLKALEPIVNKRGPGGSTPLMFAALYGDAPAVSRMLSAHADPNLRNHAGASALMWALEHVDIVRVLLDAGADASATSDFDRSPIALAAAQAGSAPVVRLLLERGAKATPAALTAAALRGDAAVVRLLLDAGARDNGAAATAALRSGCRDCLEGIAAAPPALPLRNALIALLPPAGPGNADALREAIARGADVRIRDAKARTVLMRAAIVETLSPDVARLLIERGAEVRVPSVEGGLTARDFAGRAGNAPVADVLANAGEAATPLVEPVLTAAHANTVRAAVQRALPLLQRTAGQFYAKSGCLSCHHNALTGMTVAAARQRGFVVDERGARDELATVVHDIASTPDQALQGIVIAGGQVTTTGYLLMGLAAERHPPDAATDAMVRLMRLSQHPDGRWLSAYRPPFEASEFTATAVSLRGIQLYGPKVWKVADEASIRAAASWLAQADASTTEDRVFKLLGLTWAKASQALRQSAMQALAATQRSDGGWAQLPSLNSDAYATGESLMALAEAGMRPHDPVYRRGVQFLLKTQLADGSWFVRSRSHPTQIYFESGFPHGRDQYISAAATNWAAIALIRAD